jgi:hypothetical protein
MTLRLVPVRDALSFAYMTVLPVAVYSRIFPTSRGSSIRGYWQDNSVPLFVNLPDFSVSCSHSHPSDAFYYSVDVTPVVAVAAIWLPSLSSLSKRHCRVDRYNVPRNVWDETFIVCSTLPLLPNSFHDS